MKKILLLSTFILIFLCISLFAYINADLIQAAIDGDLIELKRLIGQGADVNAKTKYGWSALMKAAYEGHKEIVELLIHAGADVNAKGKTL